MPQLHFSGPDEGRAALRARLIDDGFTAGSDVALAERRIADDLRVVLAFDATTRVVVPPREDVLELGGEDELFELALAQTRGEPDLEVMQHDFARARAARRRRPTGTRHWRIRSATAASCAP